MTGEAAEPAPSMPARNPWLTDSVYPTSHFNPGATDSVLAAGPSVGRRLSADRDVKAVTNVMVSNPAVKTIGSETVAFASGTLGILKLRLTADALDAVCFTSYPGFEDTAKAATDEAITAVLAEVDAARRAGDDTALLDAIGGVERLGVTFDTGINGVYNLFDRDGNHYCVFGGNHVLKTTDDNAVDSPVRVVTSVSVADALPGEDAKAVTRIIGLNMTYDGFLAAAAPGALVVLDRDLNVRDFLTFPGEAVDNSVVVDEHGGIYVVTSRRMLKVIWNGDTLSTDEADGAWESGYEWIPDDEALAAGSISRGSGTTPSLMGFGDDPDKLVVIADAARGGTNLVAFWREDIPTDFEQRPGTKSRRIADQAKIAISQLTIEPSANVLGYGVAVINGSYPDPVPTPGLPNAFTAGVTRPAPRGVQKFTWSPDDRRFVQAWVNDEVDNSDIMVPVVSAATGLMYCAHKDHGDYQYVGLDWATGELTQRWIFPDDSCRWNALGGITTVLHNGDLLIGGAFAIKRLRADPRVKPGAY